MSVNSTPFVPSCQTVMMALAPVVVQVTEDLEYHSDATRLVPDRKLIDEQHPCSHGECVRDSRQAVFAAREQLGRAATAL